MFIGQLAPIENKFPDDPFLQGVYWEKVAFFKGLAGDFQSAVLDYQRAIRTSYPTAHLYYDLGLSLKMLGRNQEAQKAFRKSSEVSKNEVIQVREFNPTIKK